MHVYLGGVNWTKRVQFQVWFHTHTHTQMWLNGEEFCLDSCNLSQYLFHCPYQSHIFQTSQYICMTLIQTQYCSTCTPRKHVGLRKEKIVWKDIHKQRNDDHDTSFLMNDRNGLWSLIGFLQFFLFNWKFWLIVNLQSWHLLRNIDT